MFNFALDSHLYESVVQIVEDFSSKANDLGIQQLRSFCVVFEKQSYSNAAKEFGFSVPTIWEQIQALERRYGTKLFERRGRRIFPTSAAELLYNSLRPLLAGLDSTFELLREQGGHHSHTITLVTGVRMVLDELGPPMCRFREAYPGVCLRLIHGNSEVATRMILEGEADIALTLHPGPELVQKGVCYESGYEIDFLALIPQTHEASKLDSVELSKLIDYPLIVGHRDTYGRHIIEQALHRDGLLDRLEIAAETDNSAFTAACVQAGMGVGIVAGRADGTLTSKLIVRSLRDQLGQARIVFMWKEGKQLTNTTRKLIDMIKAESA